MQPDLFDAKPIPVADALAAVNQLTATELAGAVLIAVDWLRAEGRKAIGQPCPWNEWPPSIQIAMAADRLELIATAIGEGLASKADIDLARSIVAGERFNPLRVAFRRAAAPSGEEG